MGMYGGGGGGGTTVTYQQPDTSKSDKLIQQQNELLKMQIDDAKADKKAEKDAAAAAKAEALTSFDPYKTMIQSQVGSGLISYKEGAALLEDYVADYKLSPQTKAYQALSDYYQKEVQPKQLKSQITAAYKQYTGADPTEAELKEAQTGFSDQVYKSIDDLKDVLKQSDYYQEKFNKSYLDNYYETMYGKAKKDTTTGKKTYDFTFDKSLMPTYAGDLKDETGVTLPTFKESFTGTAAEIDQNIKAIQDNKKFIYSAGLTNLQGNIDKETQKLKNEGAAEVAKISQESNIYTSLIGAFNF
jgi:hypothetical protein